MRVVTAVMALIMPFCLASAQKTTVKEGDKRYTPTRLEWLATDLNSRLGVSTITENGFIMEFIPLSGKDTILIYVTYMPDVDRAAMNVNIDTAIKVIGIDAKSYGWSSWLKVKEQIEMGKEPASK